MLLHDESRCAGRRDILADAATCPVRMTCKRFVAMLQADCGPDTPMAMFLCTTDQYEKRMPIEQETAA